MKKQLLQEGKSHMWHPFDLDYVKNGKDLIKVFQTKVIEYLNKFNSSIKIDGINGPIRLITNEEGEREFAIDRLSTAPLDVRGVTADRLRERFEKAVLQALDTDEEITIPLHKLVGMGVNLDDLKVGTILTITHRKKNKKVAVKNITTGHGFVNDGTVALNVLNAALRAAPQEMERVLQVLGMWDDTTICLNNDIVHESSKDGGQVNAVKYDEDFIAFHGLNQIYTPEGKRVRKFKEIRISDEQKRALTDLVNVINEHNPVDGFRALSPFDTVALKGDLDIDYSEALGTVVEIKMDDQNAIAKSIEQWLNDPKIKNPSYDGKYTFADGKVRSYFSKDNYVALIPDQGEEQYSVRQLLSQDVHPEITEEDYYNFASGAIFYHATRLLGRAVLKTLVNKSKVGNEALTSHEGVVMRSKAIFGVDNPIKITGDFIRDGMAGGIAKKMVKESLRDTPPEEIGDEEEEQTVPTTKGTKTVAIMPGSFKPPHLGHLGMAIELAKKADKVLVFVSKPRSEKSKRLLPNTKAEITYEKAIELWEFLKNNNNVIGDIEIVSSNNPSSSPITVLEQLMKSPEERTSYNDYDFNPDEYQKFYVGMSDKDAKSARFDMYANDPRVEKLVVPALSHSDEYKKILYNFVNNNGKSIESSSPEMKKYANDLEMNARAEAMKLVADSKRSKISANDSAVDIATKYLSKSNANKVLKMLKSLPSNLDPNNFSATDLRLLLDLKSEAYNLPVDKLIEDFVGTGNVQSYLNIIFSGNTESLQESLQDMIRRMVYEELEEASISGNIVGHMGGSNPDANSDEDEEDVNEANIHPSDLPISNPRGSSTITVTMIGSSRHRPTGVGSDAGYKKAISNKYKFDIAKSNMERAPYYDEGDIVTDLVEKVLRNLIRTN